LRRENIDKVAQLKDLPMGLPEGTVRAVLALIVAVVGLPLLLFSSQLGTTRRLPGISMALLPAFLAITLAPGRQLRRLRHNNSVASAQQAAQEQTRQAERAQNDADQKMQLAEKYKVRRMSIPCSIRRNGS
jgi:hypothetical protein